VSYANFVTKDEYKSPSRIMDYLFIVFLPVLWRQPTKKLNICAASRMRS